MDKIFQTMSKRRTAYSLMLLFLFLLTVSCATGSEVTEIPDPALCEISAAGEIYEEQQPEPGYTALVPQMEPSLLESGKETVEEPAETEEQTAIEEEVSVPVVEPKKAEPRKAYVEPTVRVQLFGGASSISLRSRGEMILDFGEASLKLKPGSEMKFKPRSSRIGIRSYAVGIATYPADEYEEAMVYARDWKEKGYTVRLIKAGGPLVQADGTIADTTVYWVALGKFKEKPAAERFRDKMFAQQISCWVIDESVLGARGNIEVLNEEGIPAGYADSRITIASTEPIRILDVPFGHGFWSSGNCEDRSYRGPVEVIVDRRGMLAAVNEIKLEEYVKGILPVEMRPAAPDESLKAQAVAARTEAMAKIGIQHVFDPYDFCASQHCQEFGGLSRRTTRTDAAVEATRGQVLMHGSKLIDAVYCANCGGHTEHNDYVWSSRPDNALRGISDLHSNPELFDSPIPESQVETWIRGTPRAYCSNTQAGNKEHFRWRRKYGASELDRIVNKHRRVGSIRYIKVLQRGVSGRALQIRIVGTRDIAVINKELQIRKVLGGLRSSMFVVDTNRDSAGIPTSFVFYGGGWGHGVGMCQAGAEGMARQGFTHEHILKHYFADAEIKILYD